MDQPQQPTDQQQQQAQQNLDVFINNLIDQKNFKDLTPEVREELKKDILDRLDDFIMTRTIAAFSDEDVEKFDKLLDENKSMDDIRQFAVDHIPNYTEFLTSVLLEFRDIYLGAPKQAPSPAEGAQPAQATTPQAPASEEKPAA